MLQQKFNKSPILQITPFGKTIIHKVPFRYAVTFNFDDNDLRDLAAWLREYKAWHRAQSSFYDQWEIRLKSDDVYGKIPFVHPENIKKMISHLEIVHSKKFHPFLTIGAHYLEAGQGIGIHTDKHQDLRETHRLLFQLNDNWDIAAGGQTLFFENSDKHSIINAISPDFGNIISFECTANSWHAVNDVKRGKRYTLIASAWEMKANQPEDYSRAIRAVEDSFIFDKGG